MERASGAIGPVPTRQAPGAVRTIGPPPGQSPALFSKCVRSIKRAAASTTHLSSLLNERERNSTWKLSRSVNSSDIAPDHFLFTLATTRPLETNGKAHSLQRGESTSMVTAPRSLRTQKRLDRSERRLSTEPIKRRFASTCFASKTSRRPKKKRNRWEA